MKFPRSARHTGMALLVALSPSLLLPVRAQQRPAPPQQQPARPAATTTKPPQAAPAEKSSPVTFDTLLTADAYGIYAEVRAVGRHAGSQEIAQLIAPLSLEGGGGAPDELMALYEFIKSHADALMTSRLMYATMPARAGVPDVLLALEMPSVEEARKFEPQLRQFVAANVEPSQPSSPAPAATGTTRISATLDPAAATSTRRRGRRRARPATEDASGGSRAMPPAAPRFQIKRAGTLIAMGGANFTFKDLHMKDQPLLVDEPGFQVARTRFSADTVFVYFNTPRMNSSTQRLIEAQEKEYRRQEELAQAEARKRAAQPDAARGDEEETVHFSSGSGNMNVRRNGNGNFSVSMNGNMNTANANVAATAPGDEAPPAPPEASPEPTPSPLSEKESAEQRQREQSRQFGQMLASLAFGRQAQDSDTWPDSIGVGASLDGDALVVRGLFISPSADQPLRPMPFLPVLLSGPSIAAEAPAVLPADTNIFLSVSLDLPQMYDYLAALMKIADLAAASEEGKGGFGEQLSAFEKTNNFRIREELIAALGNEIAVGLPLSPLFGMRPARAAKDGDKTPPPSGPVVVVALNDRESLQKLLPRVLKAIGFAGATEQSIIEKHGGVEVLTFSNGTLAFIDRFLVGAPDAATMRRVTDAYNNGETLANDERFRDATGWQPKQAVGQVYVANAMLKGMFAEVTASVDDIDDPATRAYLMRLDPNPGAITHLATRESDGLMHELRLPKNLLSLFSASALVSRKLSTARANEGMAQWKLRQIQNAQNVHREKAGRYGTLEELRAAGNFDDLHISVNVKEAFPQLETEGYEVKVSASGDTFEATATPTGYPKLGRRSYYIDQTGSLRGADLGGKPASASTPIIE